MCAPQCPQPRRCDVAAAVQFIERKRVVAPDAYDAPAIITLLTQRNLIIMEAEQLNTLTAKLGDLKVRTEDLRRYL